MGRPSSCDRGYVVEADTEAISSPRVEKHVADRHPGMSLRREEILAMAKEE